MIKWFCADATSDIDSVAIVYYWNLNKKNWLWVKYGLGKIKLYDVFSKAYTTIVTIPFVKLDKAKEYTQYFSQILKAIADNNVQKESSI